MTSSSVYAPRWISIRTFQRTVVVAVVAATIALGALGPDYVLNIAILAFTLIAVSSAFNIVYGFLGLLSLAQVAFWGIGAYTSALSVMLWSVPIWAGIGIAAVLAAVVAFVLGYPSLQLPKAAFIIFTLAFTLLCQLVARDWTSLTRGPLGIPGLPTPSLNIGGISVAFQRPRGIYFLMGALALGCVALLWRAVRSRFGRTWVGIREDETLAASLGIAVLRYKLLGFVLAAAVSGAMGGLFVFHLSIVDPTIFGPFYIQAMVISVIVGGMGSFWGVISAALFVAAVPEALRLASELRLVIFGLVLILAILYFPQGLGGYVSSRFGGGGKDDNSTSANARQERETREVSSSEVPDRHGEANGATTNY